MFAIVESILISFVEVLKVYLPFVMVFDIAGDILWRQ